MAGVNGLARAEDHACYDPAEKIGKFWLSYLYSQIRWPRAKKMLIAAKHVRTRNGRVMLGP
jgi:hypothetical protein